MGEFLAVIITTYINSPPHLPSIRRRLSAFTSLLSSDELEETVVAVCMPLIMNPQDNNILSLVGEVNYVVHHRWIIRGDRCDMILIHRLVHQIIMSTLQPVFITWKWFKVFCPS